MLTDCIVCGIKDDKMQHRLLAESRLTLKRAIEIAQSLETAAQSVQTLHGTPQLTGNSGSEAVHKVATAHVCFHCGKTNHAPAKCKFKDAKCHHCGKVGHIKTACCLLKALDKAEQPARQRNVHFMEDATDYITSTNEYTLFNLPATKSLHPLMVTMNMDN